MTDVAGRVAVRESRPADFPAIVELSRVCYPADEPWTEEELAGHREVFPAGQLVATSADGRVVGAAASLIVDWDDYEIDDSWRDFTDHGTFANHDPAGRTLYGAEVMVDPDRRRLGIGTALYDAREALVVRRGLDRFRAGTRLASYGRVADALTPEAYVEAVRAGTVADPALSFQLARGYRVLAVVPDYLRRDPSSRGCAAVVEWRPPRPASPAPGERG